MNADSRLSPVPTTNLCMVLDDQRVLAVKYSIGYLTPFNWLGTLVRLLQASHLLATLNANQAATNNGAPIHSAAKNIRRSVKPTQNPPYLPGTRTSSFQRVLSIPLGGSMSMSVDIESRIVRTRNPRANRTMTAIAKWIG